MAPRQPFHHQGESWQIVAYQGPPFDVRIPNQETVEAMQDTRDGKGKRFDDVESLFED